MSEEIDKLIESYLKQGKDFGFSDISSVDEIPLHEEIRSKDKEIKSKADTVESLRGEVKEYKERLQQIKDLVVPLLANLIKTSDKQYIKWPGRGPILKELLEKVLTATG